MAARVGGRNRVASWLGGFACVGIIGALVYFAWPMGPTLYAFVGDTLRAMTP